MTKKSDMEQLYGEMAEKLTEHFRRNGMNLARFDSAARFDGWVSTGYDCVRTEILDVLTADWSASKEMLDLDADGILRDPSAPLRHAGDDYDTTKARKVIVYELSTGHRDLTEVEQTALDERNARWEAKRARDSAVYKWRLGSSDTPPPDGIRIDELLDQIAWWVTRDGRKVRIAEMEPSHRMNLLNLMRRNAEAWKDAELNRFLMQGAPDDVTSSAEHLTGMEWLGQQRLYRELRNLVLIDQVGEETCRIEWSDDKPLHCVPGADGHVCVREPGHKKRCVCRCLARPNKDSAATREAVKTRQELRDLKPTPQQQAMIDLMFGKPSPSTGKTVQQETAERFMNLGATERMGLGTPSTAPAEAELDRYVETYGPLGPEDIH